jgi:hypothetical protein
LLSSELAVHIESHSFAVVRTYEVIPDIGLGIGIHVLAECLRSNMYIATVFKEDVERTCVPVAGVSTDMK